MLPLPELGPSQILINHDLIFIIDILRLRPSHHLQSMATWGPSEWDSVASITVWTLWSIQGTTNQYEASSCNPVL